MKLWSVKLTGRGMTRPGFTIVETLVVLAIAATMTVVLLDAVRAAFENSRRIEQAVVSATDDYLTIAAYRKTVQAIVHDYENGPAPFTGDAGQFTGLSLNAVDRPAGRPTPVTFRLSRENGEVVLNYEAGGARFALLRRRATDARFAYLGPDGQWRESWPRPAEETDLPPAGYYQRSPRAVRLDFADEIRPLTIVVALRSDAAPPLRNEDVQSIL